MALYLPPIHVSEVFNISDYTIQDGYISILHGDKRYLRPIKTLETKTTGITYSSGTTNITGNINIAGLVNSVNTAVRNDVTIGKNLVVGSNLVVGEGIINSGNIYTNDIYAKSIVIKDAVIQNNTLTNAFIDNVPISSKTLSFISSLSSDIQLQLDTNAKRIGVSGRDGRDGSHGSDGQDGRDGSDGKNAPLQPTLGGYFINSGVGSFPIHGSISNFADLGMDLYIKSEADSFCILPGYALFVFSKINEKGSYLSMGNTSATDIEYYNLDGIGGLIRVKSCVLYKLDENQRIIRVATINNKNPDKTWSLESI